MRTCRRVKRGQRVPVELTKKERRLNRAADGHTMGGTTAEKEAWAEARVYLPTETEILAACREIQEGWTEEEEEKHRATGGEERVVVLCGERGVVI